jgi:hypothetical protein
VELQVQEATGLNTIDPQELSPTLWQMATQPILFAFRYTKPYTLSVSVKRHAEVAVLTTTIDDANAVTLMTARGQIVTRIRYQVRNHLKQYLAIRLPQNAELWSAFVDGQPVKPTLAEPGVYRIPLAKSQIDGQGQQGFPVEIVYHQAGSRFSPLGYRSARFPIPDAPVSRVYWSLYLPERYRFVHFGGDMEKGMSAQTLTSMLGGALLDRRDVLGKDGALMSTDKEKRHLELKALKNAMEGASYSRAANLAAAPDAAEKQIAMEEDTLQPKPQQLAAGIFPIAFEVPAMGQLFRFGQVMVVSESPEVTMSYVHVGVLQVLLVILLAGVGGLLIRNRQRFLALFNELRSIRFALHSSR